MKPQWWQWGAFLGALLLLPLIFGSSAAITVFSQMVVLIVFALSYNLLLGGTGLLSFGHAVYFGLGGYAAIHLLRAIGAGDIDFPVALLPLVGGLVGGIAGIVLGAVATRQGATSFSMITLGLAEMATAAAQIMTGFSGGEEGVTGDRGVGTLFGASLGPQATVYYVLVLWAVICAVLMFVFTRTPVGRMANAVRENSERVEFIGYDPRRIRFIVFVVAATFAGIAGGMYALSAELMTTGTLGVTESGRVMVATYIGGIRHFFGPALGAAFVSLLDLALRGITEAWPVYLGLVFLFVVLGARSGLAGILAGSIPLLRSGGQRLFAPTAAAAAAGIIALCGIVFLVELAYRALPGAAGGGDTPFILDQQPLSWLLAGFLTVAGGYLAMRTFRRAAKIWQLHIREAEANR